MLTFATHCCHCHHLFLIVVSVSSSLPPVPCCQQSLLPLNTTTTIECPHLPPPSKDIFVVHHYHQMLPVFTPPLLSPLLSAIFATVTLPYPYRSPSPHPLNPVHLLSHCCHLLTLSNAITHWHCWMLMPHVAPRCCRHLDLIITSAPLTALSLSYATAIECHHHPQMPQNTAAVASCLNFQPLPPCHCPLLLSNAAICNYHSPLLPPRSIFAAIALPLPFCSCQSLHQLNAFKCRRCPQTIPPFADATGGRKQWQGAMFENDVGGGGGGSSIRWRLLEAAVEDGSRHQQAVWWRRLKETSGYVSSSWQMPVAKVGDDKGSGGGGLSASLLYSRMFQGSTDGVGRASPNNASWVYIRKGILTAGLEKLWVVLLCKFFCQKEKSNQRNWLTSCQGAVKLSSCQE